MAAAATLAVPDRGPNQRQGTFTKDLKKDNTYILEGDEEGLTESDATPTPRGQDDKDVKMSEQNGANAPEDTDRSSSAADKRSEEVDEQADGGAHKQELVEGAPAETKADDEEKAANDSDRIEDSIENDGKDKDDSTSNDEPKSEETKDEENENRSGTENVNPVGNSDGDTRQEESVENSCDTVEDNEKTNADETDILKENSDENESDAKGDEEQSEKDDGMNHEKNMEKVEVQKPGGEVSEDNAGGNTDNDKNDAGGGSNENSVEVDGESARKSSPDNVDGDDENRNPVMTENGNEQVGSKDDESQSEGAQDDQASARDTNEAEKVGDTSHPSIVVQKADSDASFASSKQSAKSKRKDEKSTSKEKDHDDESSQKDEKVKSRGRTSSEASIGSTKQENKRKGRLESEKNDSERDDGDNSSDKREKANSSVRSNTETSVDTTKEKKSKSETKGKKNSEKAKKSESENPESNAHVRFNTDSDRRSPTESECGRGDANDDSSIFSSPRSPTGQYSSRKLDLTSPPDTSRSDYAIESMHNNAHNILDSIHTIQRENHRMKEENERLKSEKSDLQHEIKHLTKEFNDAKKELNRRILELESELDNALDRITEFEDVVRNQKRLGRRTRMEPRRQRRPSNDADIALTTHGNPPSKLQDASSKSRNGLSPSMSVDTFLKTDMDRLEQYNNTLEVTLKQEIEKRTMVQKLLEDVMATNEAFKAQYNKWGETVQNYEKLKLEHAELEMKYRQLMENNMSLALLESKPQPGLKALPSSLKDKFSKNSDMLQRIEATEMELEDSKRRVEALEEYLKSLYNGDLQIMLKPSIQTNPERSSFLPSIDEKKKRVDVNGPHKTYLGLAARKKKFRYGNPT